jgi:hypothetical protein
MKLRESKCINSFFRAEEIVIHTNLNWCTYNEDGWMQGGKKVRFGSMIDFNTLQKLAYAHPSVIFRRSTIIDSNKLVRIF